MLLKSFFSLGLLFAAVSANSLSIRDIDDEAAPADLRTFNNAFNALNQKTDKATKVIREWNGDAYKAKPLLDDMKELIHEFNVATNNIRNLKDKLSAQDTDRTRNPLYTLGGKVDTMSTAMIDKKRQMDSIGFTRDFMNELVGLREAMEKFVAGVASRVEDRQSTTYRGLAGGIVERLDRGIRGLGGVIKAVPNPPPPAAPGRGPPQNNSPPPAPPAPRQQQQPQQGPPPPQYAPTQTITIYGTPTPTSQPQQQSPPWQNQPYNAPAPYNNQPIQPFNNPSSPPPPQQQSPPWQTQPYNSPPPYSNQPGQPYNGPQPYQGNQYPDNQYQNQGRSW